MKDTCFINFPKFILYCYNFSEVANFCTLNSKISVFLPLLKCLPSIATKLRVRTAALKLHKKCFSSQKEIFHLHILLHTMPNIFKNVRGSLELAFSRGTSISASKTHLQEQFLSGEFPSFLCDVKTQKQSTWDSDQKIQCSYRSSP